MVTTVAVVAGVVILAFGVLIAGVGGLVAYLDRLHDSRKPDGAPLEIRVAALELKVEGLPALWEDERKRVERAADSARKARASAEKKLEEYEELTDEVGVLPDVDGERGPADGVLDVQPGLGGAPDADLQKRAAALRHLWI